MKIDGQEYNFSDFKNQISEQELNLNNNALLSIFNFFDKNNDKILQDEEISKLFDFFETMDSKNGNNDNILSDEEIDNATKNLHELKKITIYDIKTFLKNTANVISSKQIANDLTKQLSFQSFNKDTKKILSKITKTNAANVITEYQKLNKKSLVTDMLNQWSIIEKLDISTIKEYICKPLVEQAKSYGIKGIYHKLYLKISDKKELNTFIDKTTSKILEYKNQKTANIPVINGVRTPFSDKTRNQMGFMPHSTKLLDIAQEYLGLQEVTSEEYMDLSPEQRAKTQMRMISNYGKANYQWCAHTVSTLCELAGIDIGAHKSSVYRNPNGNFVDWAKERNAWKPIQTNNMNTENYISERRNRVKQIQNQLSQMHEGDFVVWSAQYGLKMQGEKNIKTGHSSHIGILESVDIKLGTITVIEGNSNISEDGSGFDESYLDKLKQNNLPNHKINRRDGLIRKVYAIDNLAKFGYSGFIDNSSIIKPHA